MAGRISRGHLVTYIIAILLVYVCLHVYRNLEKASSNPSRLGRQIQLPVITSGDGGNPDDSDGVVPVNGRVQHRDFSGICSSIPNDSKTYQSLNTHLKQWQVFVPRPEGMLKDFKCSCWRSSLVLPRTISATTPDWSETIRSLSEEKAIAIAATAVASQDTTSNSATESQSLYCVPNVFLAGFRKCGSTSLYSLIVSHPMVANPNRKEGHFWGNYGQCNSEPHLQLQVLNYLGHFSDAIQKIQSNHNVLTIDASVSTSFSDPFSVPQQNSHCFLPLLHSKAVPGAKYIYILRNPVDRLWSDYWAFCKCSTKDNVSKIAEYGPKFFHKLVIELVGKMKECLAGASSWENEYSCIRKYSHHTSSIEFDLGDVCIADKSNVTCRRLNLGLGLYHIYIERWFSVIPNREQYLFLRTEDMASDSMAVMDKVWQFLNLPPLPRPLVRRDLKPKNVNPLTHHGVRFHMLPESRAILTNFYHEHNVILAKLLEDNNFVWDN